MLELEVFERLASLTQELFDEELISIKSVPSRLSEKSILWGKTPDLPLLLPPMWVAEASPCLCGDFSDKLLESRLQPVEINHPGVEASA